MLYILPINIVVLDEYTHSTLVISQNTTGMTNLMIILCLKYTLKAPFFLIRKPGGGIVLFFQIRFLLWWVVPGTNK